MSETAITDPHTGWPADHAVMFKGGKVIDLGTLRGGYESQATDINDRGQVSGFGSNGPATSTRSSTCSAGLARASAGLLADPQFLGAAAAGSGQVSTRPAGRPAATPWAPVRHHASAGPLLGAACPGYGMRTVCCLGR
jgi:hypothetical protein